MGERRRRRYMVIAWIPLDYLFSPVLMTEAFDYCMLLVLAVRISYTLFACFTHRGFVWMHCPDSELFLAYWRWFWYDRHAGLVYWRVDLNSMI